MSRSSTEITRRGFFAKVALAFNGIIGIALATPILRYLAAPVTREGKPGYNSWIPLGPLDAFPSGETRLATYRNPTVSASDGETADAACWVRNVDGNKFQVFAINCAHLGCPVRWFSESQLFMCPCHGGVYYADGSRASGPPERGLFTYDAKVENGKLMIDAGQMPTLSNRASAVSCPGTPAGMQEASNAAPTNLVRIDPWPGTKTPTIG